jgi:hypothetical protein
MDDELNRIKEGIKRNDICMIVDGNDMIGWGWTTQKTFNFRSKILQDELHRCRTQENFAAVELDKIRQLFGIDKEQSVYDYFVAQKSKKSNKSRPRGKIYRSDKWDGSAYDSYDGR